MGARRTINRYRIEPSGYDFAEVLKKGKVFHRNAYNGVFEMTPYKGIDERTFWTAHTETLPPFKKPDGTRTYKFDKERGRWFEIIE